MHETFVRKICNWHTYNIPESSASTSQSISDDNLISIFGYAIPPALNIFQLDKIQPSVSCITNSRIYVWTKYYTPLQTSFIIVKIQNIQYNTVQKDIPSGKSRLCWITLSIQINIKNKRSAQRVLAVQEVLPGLHEMWCLKSVSPLISAGLEVSYSSSVEPSSKQNVMVCYPDICHRISPIWITKLALNSFSF